MTDRLSIRATLVAMLVMAASCGEGGKATPVIKPGVVGGGDGSKEENAQGVGETMPAWKEGEFDIHFINTTSGECMFLVFPDGTQMLIDAAGSQVSTGTVGSTTNTGIRKRWDPTRNGTLYGEFISRYIRQVMVWTGNKTIDYVLLTHFHNDHFGGANGLPVSDNSSTYTKQSLPLIMDTFPIGKLMDRGYPEYNYPFDMAFQADNASNCKNYITAVKWHVANKGLNVEKFKAGVNDQITLRRKAGDYPDFKVQNIAVNGEVWTGQGTGTTKTFPDLKDIVVADTKKVTSGDKCPEENHVSCVARFSYGPFDFFAGGDMQYDGMSSFAWKDIETPVAKACGPVEVMKADHHGTANTQGTGYKDKAWAMRYLTPQCWIVNSWTDGHPRAETYNGVTGYLTGTDVFITNTCDEMKGNLTAFDAKVKGKDGHIVVRVSDGGSIYRIYTLTDSDGKMTVKSIAGPYKSR